MRSQGTAAITGRGVLSPLGGDWPSFAEAVRCQRTAPSAPFPSALPEDPVLYHPLASPPPPTETPAAGRADPLSAFATAAIEQALAEAGIGRDGYLDEVGLVMNTIFGPSLALEAYLEQLWTKGPGGARPALFVDTLLSMPAGRVGIALGLRGSTAVVNGSSPFELALDWIRSGREHTIIAGGAEYLSPKCLRHYRWLAQRSGGDRPLLAQGAAFVVLESPEHAAQHGAQTFGTLLGAGAASEPQQVALPWSADHEGTATAQAMADALKDAGLPADGVVGVCLAAGDDAAEAGERAALDAVFGARADKLTTLQPKHLLGEALGAAAGLGLLAALTVEEGASQPTTGAVLVNAFEMGGAVTSLVLRPSGGGAQAGSAPDA